jgi:4-diphosphocytidyl-2-C-methyl-D-erythritol kinase
MISFPNAKINLGLRILNARDDGYHNLESIMCPVNMQDALEIIRKPPAPFSFTTSGMEIPGSPDDNLCVRAYRMMKKKFDLPGVIMHLHKVIPMGAGLGGGSSDAASAIMMLNDLFRLGLDRDTLMDLALEIGSDCPFFIENRPVLATGRGEVLAPLSLSIQALHIHIIKPPFHIDTASAYSATKPGQSEKSLSKLIQLPVDQWRNHIYNDFEEYAFERFPELGNIKNTLYDKGALYASLTGSGSAVFGLFKDETDLKETFREYFTWAGQLS